MPSDQKLEFAWDKLSRLLEEGLDDHIREHWEEVALDKETVPYAPDYGRYLDMEQKGLFRIMSMRRGGRLVGYNAFFTMPHLHYRFTMHALNDVIYIDPEERRGWAGVRLIMEAEKALARLADPVKIFYHTKLHVAEDRGTVGRILERLGYAHVERVYAKVVSGAPANSTPSIV